VPNADHTNPELHPDDSDVRPRLEL